MAEKKPKEPTDYDYLVAIQSIRVGTIRVNVLEHWLLQHYHSEADNDYLGSIILPSPLDNPETKMIKRENYENLSNNAKEAIELVLNSPKEILDLFITPKRKKISKRLLGKWLSKCWKSKLLVEHTFKEIQEWVNKL